MKPIYLSRTFWTSLAGVLAAAAGLLAVFLGAEAQAVMLLSALAALLGNVGSVTAWMGDQNAARDVADENQG